MNDAQTPPLVAMAGGGLERHTAGRETHTPVKYMNHYTGDIIKHEYKGFEIRIKIHQDVHLGPPWREHDGHGEVSEWTTRDKRAGERVLCSDRGRNRFYDFARSIQTAKKEGWGLDVEEKARLAPRLKKDVSELTKGEITARAVELDFEHLRGWCENEWHWQGYTAELWFNGEKHSSLNASCWGFEGTDSGMEHMLFEALAECQSEVDEMEKDGSTLLEAICAE